MMLKRLSIALFFIVFLIFNFATGHAIEITSTVYVEITNLEGTFVTSNYTDGQIGSFSFTYDTDDFGTSHVFLPGPNDVPFENDDPVSSSLAAHTDIYNIDLNTFAPTISHYVSLMDTTGWVHNSNTRQYFHDHSSHQIYLHDDRFDTWDSDHHVMYYQLLYNPTTGIGHIAYGDYEGDQIFNNERIEFKVVPEPTAMLLFGTGLAGLAAVGRRRKK